MARRFHRTPAINGGTDRTYTPRSPLNASEPADIERITAAKSKRVRRALRNAGQVLLNPQPELKLRDHFGSQPKPEKEKAPEPARKRTGLVVPRHVKAAAAAAGAAKRRAPRIIRVKAADVDPANLTAEANS